MFAHDEGIFTKKKKEKKRVVFRKHLLLDGMFDCSVSLSSCFVRIYIGGIKQLHFSSHGVRWLNGRWRQTSNYSKVTALM